MLVVGGAGAVSSGAFVVCLPWLQVGNSIGILVCLCRTVLYVTEIQGVNMVCDSVVPCKVGSHAEAVGGFVAERRMFLCSEYPPWC